MKKVLLFLSILVFIFTGTMFACSSDRYADLRISDISVTLKGQTESLTPIDAKDSSGKTIYQYYEIEYGDEFFVEANVYCSNEINTALVYTSVNDNAVHLINTSHTEKGTRATFQAVYPSYSEEQIYRIKIESVETGRKSQDVFVKVVLPVDQILLTDNLGLTYGAPIDMNAKECITYLIADPAVTFETTQKGFKELTLDTYTNSEGKSYVLNREKINENLSLFKYEAEDASIVEAFKVEKGVITVLDKSIEGSVKVTAKSVAFDDRYENPTEQDVPDVIKNNKLKDDTVIEIVKPVTIDDISFAGGQIAFARETEGKYAKLNASLYLNSLETYTLDGKTHYNYNYEDLAFTVYTKANIKIVATAGDMLYNDQIFKADPNIVTLPNSDNLSLNPITEGPNREVVGYETVLKFIAAGGSGNTYVDLIVEYTDYANKLQYSFSELYSEYLRSLDEDKYKALNNNAKTSKIVFEATAIPAVIALKQDDKALTSFEDIKIYDSYGENDGMSTYGTKFGVNLTLASGTTSSKIKNENKQVKVVVSDMANSGLDVGRYFDIYDSAFNRIVLSSEKKEGVTNYYFMLDLTNDATSYFYVKATSANLSNNASFKFNFENILASKITAYNNTEIVPNSDNTTLKNLTTSFSAKTVKGVEEILVVTKVTTDKDYFHAIDNNNLKVTSEYNKLVLQLNNSETQNMHQGSLIGFMTNRFVSDEIKIKADESFVKIYTLNTIDYSEDFIGGYDASTLEFKGALSVIGLKLGSTVIEFYSDNGFKVEVEVVVVDTFKNLTLDLKQGKNEDVISQNFINSVGANKYPYDVSARIDGVFNILYKVEPNDSSIFDVEYSSSVSGVVEINHNTGLVRTISKGRTTITVNISYYKFGVASEDVDPESQFRQWVKAVETRVFVLEVYVPFKTVRLDKRTVNVYDYNSLGYEYKNQAAVNINVIVTPEDASILNDGSSVSFYPSNNKNNLVGKDGIYTAYLNENEKSKTVYLSIYVNQYGRDAYLECTVNIFRAPQVEDINISIFENQNQKSVEPYGYDTDRHEVLFVSTKNSRSLKVNTSIIPAGINAVLVDDLVAVVYNAVVPEGGLEAGKAPAMSALGEGKGLAEFDHYSVNGITDPVYRIITEGLDSFTLNISPTDAGYFYVVIFARDSMINESAGKVYLKLLIQITDGTQENPYEVTNVNELIDVNKSPDKHYVLGADINLASVSNWTPIKNFTGSFNGYNVNKRSGTYFKITGLKINSISSTNVGLFETISNSAQTIGAVMNLYLGVNSINLYNYQVADSLGVKPTINIGTIAGTNEGAIINCAVKFDIFRVYLTNANANIGGVVGLNTTGIGNIGGAIINFNQNASNASIAFDLSISSENNVVAVGQSIPETAGINMISPNPVNGNIIVGDRAAIETDHDNAGELDTGVYVFVGGMVGCNNKGYINGIYGIYNLANEKANYYMDGEVANNSSITYLTNYQSQGVDVSIKINNGIYSEIGNISHKNTSIGGVVGVLDGGYVLNTSVEGNIGMFNKSTEEIKGAYDNVGGIVGKTVANATVVGMYNFINEVSASVKIRAYNNVGGIAGNAKQAEIYKARVESYEDPNADDQTLIIVGQKTEERQEGVLYHYSVGGVVGKVYFSTLTYVYSYSFVDKFNEDYIEYGDIYSLTDGIMMGGLVGTSTYIEYNTTMTILNSYSTFNLVATKENSLVGGIIGGLTKDNSISLKNVFYVGVIENAGIDIDAEKSKINFAGTYIDSNDAIAIDGYTFHYILEYADSSNFVDGANYDCLIIKKDASGYDMAFAGNESEYEAVKDDFSKTGLLKVNIYDEDAGGIYQQKTLELRVPAYLVSSGVSGTLTCYFIRSIPESISVNTNGTEVLKENDTFVLNFLTGSNKNYFFSNDKDGNSQIIINYSSVNNSFELSDLFEVVPNPTIYGNLNILVSSSDDKKLVITADGKLQINAVGNYDLTFRVKENARATVIVKVLVLKNFDKILVSENPNYQTSLFTSESEPNKLRVNDELNLFNIFAEYVELNKENQDKVYYDVNEDDLYLMEISNLNSYSLGYRVEFMGEGNSTYVDATPDQYVIANNAVQFSVIGDYKVTLFVVFENDHIDYKIVNNAQWVLYFNVYSGATSATFNMPNFGLQGDEIQAALQLTLISDHTDKKVNGDKKFEDLTIVIRDTLSNADFDYHYEYVYNYQAEDVDSEKEILVPIVYNKYDDNKIVAKNYPFNIDIAETSVQDDIYYYTFTISITTDFKEVIEPVDFVLMAYDANKALIANPATVEISIVPQGVRGVSGIHYAFTNEVSKIENVGNTEAGEEGAEINYSYNFTNEPKDTVIAGSDGLFVIDINPFYANITSIEINSSLGTSGNALQFVQLVKIKQEGGLTDNSYYYIHAPMTQRTETNGIYLNKFSYVPSSVSTIKNIEGVLQLTNPNIKASDYGFVEESERYSSGVARLYVKTYAPTNLQEEESFVVTVTVKYNVINEQGQLVERVWDYDHTLVVESMPGFEIVTTHDGVERDVIAFTGANNKADWLEVKPLIQEGYEYDKITVGVLREGQAKVTYNSTDAFISGGKLYLGSTGKLGDQIVLTMFVSIKYDGYKETRTFTKNIKVVDVVITSISVKDIDDHSNLKITVSTSRQLKAVIEGFGTKEALEEAENAISRSVTKKDNLNYYWQAKSNKAGEQFINLEAVSLRNSLPFVVKKISINNSEDSVTVDKTFIGSAAGEGTQTFDSVSKVIVLEGSTESGIVQMRLTISYVYNSTTGEIVFVPTTYGTTYNLQKYFNVVVTEDSNEDNPTPIYDEDDLKEMSRASMGSFILMNDIEISNHTALEANFASFDGNNKVITIKNFVYNTNITGESNMSINLGLFNTVSDKTIIKNVVVAYPADKDVAMNLKGYTTIKFGGIAAINKGVITNCDVITVTDQNNYSIVDYVKNAKYTWNIETASSINGTAVDAKIGGLVAINEASGFITNSRVGREHIDILKVYDSEAAVVYKEDYKPTAPMTLLKVYGRANVAGFVVENNGTISTSYAKNLQMEVVSISPTMFVKTGGFTVTNKGFIYGSYVAGWEEETAVTEEYTESISSNRKLGGGIYSNGLIGGFVYSNQSYIQDCYSNINLSGKLLFAAQTNYIKTLKAEGTMDEWSSPAVGGFAYITTENSYITTSYSMSKISAARLNTHGAFEGRDNNSPDVDFANDGEIENCYFMLEKVEDFSYEHERARMLSDDPVIDLEGEESVAGTNEFINKASFNSFSFDNSIDDFNGYHGESMGGVWAIYKQANGINGYPELISANTIAISCRVINVTKTNNSETNTYYYTYVDGYDLGSAANPHIVSSFEQYNNIFRDAIGQESFNENITTKFTGNIRLIKNINFSNSREVYSTSIEYTSLTNLTSIFDGNYLAMYNVSLADSATGKSAFGLFKDIYYAGVKNLTLAVDSVDAGNTTAVGVLAGAIVNSNISNITIVAASKNTGTVTGNNYVGALAGVIISNDQEEVFTISNIKSNLAIIGNTSDSETSSAITRSFEVWDRVKPTSSSSGLTEINNNLRLHRLPTNVNYAGGIAGFVDLHQKVESSSVVELTNPNAYNIHVGEFIPNTILGSDLVAYDRVVSVISDFSGGLFGFVGSQTFVECAEFIAVTGSEEHFISAGEIAGGITAVNFGKLSQTYLSFNEQTVKVLNDEIVKYVGTDASANVHINTTLFSEGKPNYVGGIAGINVGNGSSLGTGTIIDSYNRVDVKNTNAKGVGGIVGATYIGQISNVYTTASLMGDTTNPDTKIGAIIGKIFENSSEGYFADNYGSGTEDYEIVSLFNIVALNLWDSEDFEELSRFVNSGGGSIGALYGKYENQKAPEEGESPEEAEKEDGLVRMSGYIFVQNYALQNYDNPYISTIDHDEDFDITKLEYGSYFELWGVSPIIDTVNYDRYLAAHLVNGESSESLIYPNDYRALLSKDEFGTVSTLRNTYFPSTKWSRIIWNYDDEHLLPILEYGYESSVIRIYTANQFISKLKEGNSSGKLYVIMNDIDFEGIDLPPISTTFRGQLYGNNVTYKLDGTTYTRKPILFNVTLDRQDMDTGVFAILQNSIGATYSNFNIVLKKYDVQFNDESEDRTETVASVLLGNSINSTINNVNIYSSLYDVVNKESMLDYQFSTEMKNADHMVTQGYYVDESTKEISSYSAIGYLKLATLNSKDEATTDKKSFNIQYAFIQDKNSTPNNNSDDFYKLVAKEDLYTGKPVEFNDGEEGKTLEVSQKCVATTNASTVGLFIGVGSLSYLTSSSVNVNINVVYNSVSAIGDSIKYIGGAIGRNVGEIRYVVSTSSITVSMGDGVEESDQVSDMNELYVGGVIGNVQGIIRFAYVKNNTIKIGSAERYIVTSGGNSGVFVGGVVGAVDRYTTVNEAIVGGANFMYINDCHIETYSKGDTRVAGAIAQNSFTVGDIYLKQSPNGLGTGKQKSIKVFVKDAPTAPIVGGLIATNKSTLVSNAYSNTSIYVTFEEFDATDKSNFEAIYIGGIVGQTDTDAEFINIINDAKEIVLKRNSTNKIIGNVYIGGVLAQSTTDGSEVVLSNVFSSVNIVSGQERNMFIGGTVGSGDKLTVNNVIVLGNITLNRGKGDGLNVIDPSAGDGDNGLRATFFYGGSHFIGGLVGECEKGYTQKPESKGTIVLSTIRDYALAQKLNVHIGPVIGTENEKEIPASKTYFCEAISLVSDNGYNEYFENIPQIYLAKGKEEGDIGRFNTIFDQGTFKEGTFVIDTSEKVYSNYYTNYFDRYLATPNFKAGTKLNPTAYSGVLEANKYYYLNEDLTSSLVSSEAKNWVLNGFGNRVNVSNGPAIETIPEGAAIVGIMTYKAKNTDGSIKETVSNAGLIAKNNYGFMFACGSAGAVKTSSSAGIVWNNYGVINSCFSIADIYVNSGGAGAGLVVTNGNSTYVGNIYSSYHTGTIAPLGINTRLAGLAIQSSEGVISNSYTMGDIDVTEWNAETYPIANTTSKFNTQNTYYDYLCYAVEDNNNGVTQDYASHMKVSYQSLDTLKPSVAADETLKYGLIASKGIYVWSSTLAGDEGGLYYTNFDDLFKGSWLKPGDEKQLVEFYLNSTYAGSKTEEEVIMDTSWLNYGYTTNNLVNILVNHTKKGSTQIKDNIIAYLEMLYTGNGLKDITNLTGAKVKTLDPFIDQPYQIKHAGMLDILVRSNNNSGQVVYKFYMFIKNIDFVKYSGVTYWSQSWDRNETVFVGDLNGAGHSVMNMYSTYGLVRAMPSGGIIPSGLKTTVRDIVFRNCYSKTGLVAGYQEAGIIKDITIGDDSSKNYVINGDITNFATDIKTGNKVTFLQQFKDAAKQQPNDHNFYCGELSGMFVDVVIDRISYRIGSSDGIVQPGANFAGGLVGLMQGGEITGVILNGSGSEDDERISFTNLTVTVEDDAQINDTFIGGIVGILQGGKIKGVSTELWQVVGINTFASLKKGVRLASNVYVGGIAGLVSSSAESKGVIEYVKVLKLENTPTISGYNGVGGIAGMLDQNGTIQFCQTDVPVTVGVSRQTAEGSFNSGTDVETAEIMVGGVVGYMKAQTSGGIKDCQVTSNFDLNAQSMTFAAEENFAYVGGIVGKLESGAIDATEGQTLSGTSINTAFNVKTSGTPEKKIFTYVGGIVGYMIDGSVKGNTYTGSSANISSASNTYAIAGGIVGYMINGKISGAVKSSANVQADNASGGIVGQITIGEQTSIEIDADVKDGDIQTTSATVQEKATVTEKISGGIVGFIENLVNSEGVTYVTIKNCEVDANANVGVGSTSIAGGIVGAVLNASSNQGSISDIKIVSCKNKGTIQTTSTNLNEEERVGILNESGVIQYITYAGGIVGYAHYVEITKSTNTGKVGNENNSAVFAGGIVGYLEYGSISFDSSSEINSGAVTGKRVSGGIIGVTLHGILKGYIKNTGSVSINASSSQGVAGGIVGLNGNVGASLDITNVTDLINAGIIGGNSSKAVIAGGIFGIYNEISVEISGVKNTGAVNTTDGSILIVRNVQVMYKANQFVFEQMGDTSLEITEDSAGGIVGYSSNGALAIQGQSSSEGTIKASVSAGGIIGAASLTSSVTISDVVNKGSVEATGSASKGANAGGIIGKIESTNVVISTQIGGVINKGSIKSTINAGGIVGLLAGSSGSLGEAEATSVIINEGVVESTGAELSETNPGGNAGGIIGSLISSAYVYNVKNEGSVKSINSNAGGIVGYMYNGTLETSCIIDLKDDATIQAKYAGGAVGYLKNGTTKLDITDAKFGVSDYVGGIVGYYKGGTIEGTLNCNITNGKKAIGGAVGLMNSNGASLEKANVANEKTITAVESGHAGGLVGILESGNITAGRGGKAIAINNGSAGGIVGSATGGTINKKSDTEFPTGGNAKASFGNEVGAGGLVGIISSGSVNISSGNGGNAEAKHAGGLVGLVTAEGNVLIIGGNGGNATNGDATNNGGIVGKMVNGQISNVTGGIAKNANNNGGIVGYLGGSGKNPTIGSVSGTTASGGNAGGIAGYMISGTINSGYASTVEGGNAGGSVGLLEYGNVNGGGASSVTGSNAGGVVGRMINGFVKGGWCNGVTAYSGGNAGGTVGKMEGGSVSGGGVGSSSVTGNGTAIAGGVIGLLSGGKVLAGTVSAKVESSSGIAGGIVGKASGQPIGFTKFNGTVKAGSEEKGGGVLGQGSAEISGGTIEGEIVTGCGVVGTVEDTVYVHGDLTINAKLPATAGVVTTTLASGKVFGTASSIKITIGESAEAKKPLVETNEGTIIGITVSGKFASFTTVFGCIAKENKSSGSIANCTNSISVEASCSALGGIVGDNAGVVYNCTNDGVIKTKYSTGHVGGIAGKNSGEIGSCTNNKSIYYVSDNATSAFGQTLFKYDKKSTPYARVGGIAGSSSAGKVLGHNNGSIYNNVSYTSGKSSSITDYRGQIVGEATGGTVKNLTVHTTIGIIEEILAEVLSKYRVYVTLGMRGDDLYKVFDGESNYTAIDALTMGNYDTWFRDRTGGAQKVKDMGMSSYIIPDGGYDSAFEGGDPGTYWDDGALTFAGLTYLYNQDTEMAGATTGFAWRWHEVGSFDSVGYAAALGKKMEKNVYDQKVTPTGLQDCGGKISSAEEGERESHGEVNALKELYDLCGPCDTVTDSVTAPTAPSSGSTPETGGSAGTQSGSASGNGGGIASTATGNHGYAWPFRETDPNAYHISSPFGNRNPPKEGASSWHKGIDIGLPEGVPIRAMKEGKVTAAGYNSGMGNYVTIDHEDGITTYMHMVSWPSVSTGDTVAQGQEIGKVGTTGTSTGNHLHVQLYVKHLGGFINILALFPDLPVEGNLVSSVNPSSTNNVYDGHVVAPSWVW